MKVIKPFPLIALLCLVFAGKSASAAPLEKDGKLSAGEKLRDEETTNDNRGLPQTSDGVPDAAGAPDPEPVSTDFDYFEPISSGAEFGEYFPEHHVRSFFEKPACEQTAIIRFIHSFSKTSKKDVSDSICDKLIEFQSKRYKTLLDKEADEQMEEHKKSYDKKFNKVANKVNQEFNNLIDNDDDIFSVDLEEDMRDTLKPWLEANVRDSLWTHLQTQMRASRDRAIDLAVENFCKKGKEKSKEAKNAMQKGRKRRRDSDGDNQGHPKKQRKDENQDESSGNGDE